MVENHVNNPEIIIAETSPKQAVYIYGCKNSTVQVRHAFVSATSACRDGYMWMTGCSTIAKLSALSPEGEVACYEQHIRDRP